MSWLIVRGLQAVGIGLIFIVLMFLAATGIAVYRRAVIMYSTGYSWKDAGVVLHRRSKAAISWRPGLHRSRGREQQPAVTAEVLVPLPPARWDAEQTAELPPGGGWDG